MLRTILRQLFGAGQVPGELRAALEGEGAPLIAEGLWGSVTYRAYRSPQRFSSWGRRGLLGAVALSNTRVVAYGWHEELLNVAYAAPAAKALQVSHKAGKLLIAFEASRLRADHVGQVTLRFTTPQAAIMCERLCGHLTA